MSRRPKTPPRPARRPARPSAPPAAPATPWTARIRPAHVALALAGLHLALVLLSLNPAPHSGGDNAAYLALARSLRDHGTYQELWDPARRPHTQYPPGWPTLLALAMTLGFQPWMGFKVIVAGASAAAVGLSYLWARRLATPGTALALGVLLAVGTGVVDTGRWELSDPPFWALTMLALWGFARLMDRDGHPTEASSSADDAPPAPDAGREGWRAWIGPVALASGATLVAHGTRSAGLPLLVAGAAWLAWRRRWAWLGVFAAFVVPFALFWWARGRAAGGPGYAGYLWYVDPYRPGLGTVGVGGMVSRIAANAVEYTTQQLPYLLTGVRTGTPAAVLGSAVVLLGLAGWALRMRRPGVAELWLPMYVGLVLIWPHEWAGERFLLPALPMLLLCAAEPVRRLAARTRRAAWAGAAVVAVVAVVVLAALPPMRKQVDAAARCRAAYGPQNPFPCLSRSWVDFLDLARGLRGDLPPDAAVLSRKSTLFWAYAQVPSRTYPFTDDPDTLFAAAREAGARYVVLDYMDQVSTLYLAPVIMQRPQAFCVMRTVGPGRATLMAILPGAEQMPNVRGRPGDETVDLAFRTCPPEYWAPGVAP